MNESLPWDLSADQKIFDADAACLVFSTRYYLTQTSFRFVSFHATKT